MAKNYWLVKQEPEAYSWDDLVKDGGTDWTGVRNYQARNHLRSMKKGDLVFFYHSVTGKEVVGLAKVDREFFPDPTANEGDWSAVHLVPHKRLKRAVSLEQIKEDPALSKMALIRQSRLSVMPLSAAEGARLLELSETASKR